MFPEQTPDLWCLRNQVDKQYTAMNFNLRKPSQRNLFKPLQRWNLFMINASGCRFSSIQHLNLEWVVNQKESWQETVTYQCQEVWLASNMGSAWLNSTNKSRQDAKMDREAWIAGRGKLHPKVPESDTLSKHMTMHYEKLLVNTHRLNFWNPNYHINGWCRSNLMTTLFFWTSNHSKESA